MGKEGMIGVGSVVELICCYESVFGSGSAVANGHGNALKFAKVKGSILQPRMGADMQPC
jgi:hypothetical protein